MREPSEKQRDEAEGPIPSGRWHGFYVYRHSPARHRMDLTLEFRGGVISGDGIDDIARFYIRGRYEEDTLRCRWTKQYLGMHSVFYEGAFDLGSIWGLWHLPGTRGGFRIWPHGTGEQIALEAYEAIPEEDAVPVGPRIVGDIESDR